MKNLDPQVLNQSIDWKESDDPAFNYYAQVDGTLWTIKVNPDFPEEDLYTLTIKDQHLNFNNWPDAWER